MTWSLPTYSECSTSYTNLSYSFFDETGALLTWIAVDSDPTKFKVTLSKTVYLTYLEQTVDVTIEASDNQDANRVVIDATFRIILNR